MIIAIDPGITSGVAIKDDAGNYATYEYSPYQKVWQLLTTYRWDAIVCENFVAVDISRYGIITVRIVGGIECYATLNNIPLTIQQNIMRIPFKQRATDMIIAQFGKRMPRDHRMDALAHLLCWESKQ